MAGVSNDLKSRSKSCHIVHDIVFDGALLSTTRAALVTELLHYFLYERQQIPLPIDQLRFRTTAWSSESTTPQKSDKSIKLINEQTQHCHRQEHAKRIASNRKAKSLLADLKQLSDNLKKAFENCTEIEQVALLLGGTAVSPKESLVINFPPPCPDADCLSMDTCKRTLFKQMICGDILGSLSTNISPSNIIMLLSAPRSHPLSWFLPKHSLTAPKTGTVLSINFHCTYFVPICHNLTVEEESINISGLEALDCSQCQSEDVWYSTKLKSKNDSKPVFQNDDASEAEIHDIQSTHLNVSPSSTKMTGQFCPHQKLNFVFRSDEKNFKKVIRSPKRRTLSSSFIESCAISITDHSHMKGITEYDTCESENHYDHSTDQSSCQNLKGHQNNLNGDAKEEDVDCLWYQSPVILKGYRE